VLNLLNDYKQKRHNFCRNMRLAGFLAGNGFLGQVGLNFCNNFSNTFCFGAVAYHFWGKKFKFVDEAGRFFLVGAFADVIDIKVYQLLFFVLPFSTFIKAISFLVATLIKYWWNKGWAFFKEGAESKHTPKEILLFFGVTLIGLLLNVASFYFFDKIETGLEPKLWTEVSIILAALVAAVWNFLGYKFLVFKDDKFSIV